MELEISHHAESRNEENREKKPNPFLLPTPDENEASAPHFLPPPLLLLPLLPLLIFAAEEGGREEGSRELTIQLSSFRNSLGARERASSFSFSSRCGQEEKSTPPNQTILLPPPPQQQQQPTARSKREEEEEEAPFLLPSPSTFL